MEQFGLALILFAAFWVGCAAGYIAMRLRAQVAYEKGQNESAAEVSALKERLIGRDQQFEEARQRAESNGQAVTRLEGLLRDESDRRNVAEARLALLPKYEEELEARGRKVNEQQKELLSLHANVSALSTRLDEMKRSSDEHKTFLDRAGETLSNLKESSRGDAGQREAMLGEFVEPLKSSLDRVDARINELERERVAAFAGLQQQVENMMRAQASLQTETAHLATALRTPASRGRWGEIQLRRVVELAGMIEHCDFLETRNRGVEDAARPDLIVQLPNRRQIVVDSKVSLAAYLESCEVADEAVRTEKRRQHAAQIRALVTQLSAKEYWDQFPQSPEFVVAFLPGEAFFSAALEHDPELLEFGVERRVILATPTTLIALLRAVAWGWKQEMVSSNAREVRDLGKALYDRLRALSENFMEVQRGLSRTTAAFNRTVGSFETSVIPAARRLRELGASTGDEIVSPIPVDSTPRSLHLLAEAAESESSAASVLSAPAVEVAAPAHSSVLPLRVAAAHEGVRHPSAAVAVATPAARIPEVPALSVPLAGTGGKQEEPSRASVNVAKTTGAEPVRPHARMVVQPDRVAAATPPAGPAKANGAAGPAVPVSQPRIANGNGVPGLAATKPLAQPVEPVTTTATSPAANEPTPAAAVKSVPAVAAQAAPVPEPPAPAPVPTANEPTPAVAAKSAPAVAAQAAPVPEPLAPAPVPAANEPTPAAPAKPAPPAVVQATPVPEPAAVAAPPAGNEPTPAVPPVQVTAMAEPPAIAALPASQEPDAGGVQASPITSGGVNGVAGQPPPQEAESLDAVPPARLAVESATAPQSSAAAS